jgi:hypothetical protein
MENIKEFRFRGCKYLEFNKKEYPSCRRVPVGRDMSYLCWERPAHANFELCQFCKMGRRRINDYMFCLDISAKCKKYEEIEHIVSVPVSEIEPPLSRVDKHKIKNYLTHKITNYDSLEIINTLDLKIDVNYFIKDFLKSLTVV